MVSLGWRGFAHISPVGPPPDTTPPSIPENVLATYVGRFVTVTADSSTDDVDVLGYRLYRDAVRVGTTFSDPPVFSDNVTPGSYAYTVTAVDTALNESDPSDPFTLDVEAPPDTTPPSVPGNVSAAYNSGTHVVTVTWDASTDDRAVLGYVIWRDGNPKFISYGPALAWTETLTVTGTYAYTVSAFDAVPNHSAQSASDSVTVTIAPPPDTTPPSKPTDVTATFDGLNVNVAWTASTDSGGGTVANYLIYRNNILVGLDTTSPFQDTPTAGTYTYKIEAVDTSFNFSGLSTGATVTRPSGNTPSLDTTGTTDVSAGMAAFIAGLPAGSGASPTVVNFPTGAIYQMETTWTIARDHLVINGNGATIRCSDPDGGPGYGTALYPNRGRCNLELRDSTNITVNGLVIEGANRGFSAGNSASYPEWTGRDDPTDPLCVAAGRTYPAVPVGGFDGWYLPDYEAQHGINVVSCTDVRIVNCTIRKVWGDFVCVARGNPGTPRSTGTVIENNTCRGNGRQGVALVGADDTTIWNNSFDEMRRTVFDLEPGNASYDGVDGALIENNTVGRHKLNFCSAVGRGQVDNVTISGNQNLGAVTGCALIFEVGAADGTRRANWTVTDNTGTVAYWNSKQRLMSFTAIDGLTVTGNSQPLNTTHIMFGVDVQDCTDVTVSWASLSGVFTSSPSWPAGADGETRYKNAAGAVVGYSPTWPAVVVQETYWEFLMPTTIPVAIPFSGLAGSTDSAKLATFCSTYSGVTFKPTLVLDEARDYTFTAPQQVYSGFSMIGGGFRAIDQALSAAPYPQKVKIRCTSGTGWLTVPNSTVIGGFIGGLTMDATSAVYNRMFAPNASATFQDWTFRDLSYQNGPGIMGSPSQSQGVRACAWDGFWNINNITDETNGCAFNLGGSDNRIVPSMMLIDTPTSLMDASGCLVRFSSLSKTSVEHLYITAEQHMGVNITGGNADQMLRISECEFEGRNYTHPSYGCILRVSMDCSIKDSWISFGMSDPTNASGGETVNRGMVHCDDGNVLIDGCYYQNASGVANTVPFVYATTGVSYLRVTNCIGQTNSTGARFKPTVKIPASWSSGTDYDCDSSVTVVTY